MIKLTETRENHAVSLGASVRREVNGPAVHARRVFFGGIATK
jgi:hypothetical protein